MFALTTEQQMRDAERHENRVNEHGWSLPRCDYPAFRRAWFRRYGWELNLRPYLTDSGNDKVVWMLMEVFDECA